MPTGHLGYLGRTAQGKGLGTLAERFGWNAALETILAPAFLGILLLSLTSKLRPLAVEPAPLETVAADAPDRGAR